MAIAFVGGKTVGSTDGGNNATTASHDSTGATLAVAMLGHFQPTTPTISDSKSNTPYTALTIYNLTGNSKSRAYYFASPVVGASHTGTVTGSADFPSIGFATFSGVKLVSPFDQENGGTGSSVSTLAVGSVTPGENNELIITSICFDGAITGLSVGGGFTIIDAAVGYSVSQHYGFAFAYLIQGAASAVNPTWSWTTARNVSGNVATFKAAAVTGGGPLISGGQLTSGGALARGRLVA